ncbi:MAG: hypothetical protein AAFW75_25900 [Cyanobacteria bacterium J06636_16]
MSLRTPLSLLLIGTLASAGATFTAGAATAQTSSEIDPLEGLATDDDGSDFFGDNSNPFDVIHRAIQRPSMSSDEFQQQQRSSINTEAESFRLRQQEALRQQQPEADEANELTINEDEAL